MVLTLASFSGIVSNLSKKEKKYDSFCFLKAAVDISNNNFHSADTCKSLYSSLFEKINLFRPIYTTDGPLPAISFGVLLMSEILC